MLFSFVLVTDTGRSPTKITTTTTTTKGKKKKKAEIVLKHKEP
jgi:hypothetical protein